MEPGRPRYETGRKGRCYARRSFRALIEQEPAVNERLESGALAEVFDYRRFLRHLPVVFERLDEPEALTP
jgi:hypothetical protein